MSLLRFGVMGSTIAAICCFTPALVILLTTAGAASIVAYLDYVLLPALIVFIGITVFAFYKKQSV